jgi:hypothetical protein
MAGHELVNAQVTMFHRGVPVEITAACSECSDLPLTGRGTSLDEARTDLLGNFADHAGYADRATQIRSEAS